MFLDSYESWGVLPTVRIGSVEELDPEQFRTQEILSVARAWQQLGLKPDFESDWESDTLFQYIGRDGEIVTLKTTDGGTIFDLPQKDAGYERGFGVTQVKTDRNLPNWHAYNETQILGLNPNQSYFFSDIPRDFSQIHINDLPEDVFVAESRVTNNAAFFRLERANIYHEIDLLSQFHLVRTGIVVDGEELPRQKGAAFHPTEDSISGIHKSAIDAHPPWQNLIGNAFGEFSLLLPESPHIGLEFDIGLAEGSENSDGVTFIVSVQGDEIFRRHHKEQRWQHISLNLASYRGQHITLRFTTNPGSNGNASWDWARWGEPKIIAEPPDTLTQVGFFLPNEPIKSFPDTVRHTGQRKYVLETELPVQILFLFQPGQQVVSPYNLIEAEFVVGLQFGNIFRLGNVYGSGKRSHGTVGGVQKETINAHPPEDGQTILQFLLSLPEAKTLTFSFLMELQDGCSDGVFFKVLGNGETQFEHFSDTSGWVDAHISLSEFAGETVLLELVTDPHELHYCDWAYWGDLLITAEDAGVEAPNRIADANQSVKETKLLSNYPNPFNPETWIPYQLADAVDVSVKIYDVSGRLVRTISIGFKPVGYYLTRERAAYWDGRNEAGEPVSSGVYFIQFLAGDFTATQQVVIVK
ncbi:T9SS type A sorting domain-containing protein [Candidatus Poribacteria bacterium]|nr:T9SS type A sorting domain-containing protein [Candidatus Poribacteria bacterium]